MKKKCVLVYDCFGYGNARLFIRFKWKHSTNHAEQKSENVKPEEAELIIKETKTIAKESPKLEITENDKTEPVTDEEIIESDPIVGIVEK